MGIRINKTMCYFAENTPFDKKVLSDFIEDMTLEELQKKAKADNYWEGKDYVSNLILSNEIKSGRGGGISNNILWDEEFIGEGVIGFLPFGCHDWHRYDDSIDYHEFYSDNPDASAEPRFKYLNRSLYPYEGYMNRYTGEHIKDYHNTVALDKHIKHEDRQKWLDTVTGGVSMEVFKYNAIPRVPEDIKMIIHYSGAFPDVMAAYLALRPAIVTHWS